MLKIILVSATRLEIEPTLLFLEHYRSEKQHTFIFGKLEIETCITQVGMVNTAFELGKFVGRNFDIAINAGLAGSFGEYDAGEVLNVTDDCFSELGAEDGTNFISSDVLGLGEQRVGFNNLIHNLVTDKLPMTSGITVNTVHGDEDTIEKIKKAYKPGVETMEGAAFIQAANAFNWRGIQLRAISNKVEKRNKNNWQIPLAIKNLNEVLIELIKSLAHS
ncbi:phosphorylase family protein [Aurantibacillus circumpalustris]|uniref:phosphorylase family protein n=1 Tax=Aurantibacillus circumpalustris TaxID=3036359 RepID=UPI00295AABC7|nr:futalosine hydrolase [Aurantibacillus circumpalustris]